MGLRLLVAVLALTSSNLLVAAPAVAQSPTALESAARLRLSAPAPATPARLAPLVLPDSVQPRRKDHTVTGLLIGGGIGFIAGWAFYDTICEAVDNRCSDSRVGLVGMGTAIGAGLGALIGSEAD